ncbi:MAG TPA: hypothetical protein VG477_09570, partial [Thermoanaerobaculia bacterium]|nr:hypothetical protein [Thermoanaerobaculia bacterium]
ASRGEARREKAHTENRIRLMKSTLSSACICAATIIVDIRGRKLKYVDFIDGICDYVLNPEG